MENLLSTIKCVAIRDKEQKYEMIERTNVAKNNCLNVHRLGKSYSRLSFYDLDIKRL